MKLGKRYRVVFTVSGYSSGGVAFRFGANQKGTTRSSNATFSEDVTVTDATGSTYIGLVAVGTTSLVVDNFSIVQIGAVAEYDGSGVASDYWFDKSGNDLHGTVGGATVENAPADADSGLVYEEGTINTAFLQANGTFITDYSGFDSSDLDNVYTRIGDLVNVRYSFDTVNANLHALQSAGTGALKLKLPFTPRDDASMITGYSISYYNSAYGDIYWRITGNSALLELFTDKLSTTLDSSDGTGGAHRKIIKVFVQYHI